TGENLSIIAQSLLNLTPLSSGLVEMAALGRHLNLGMFYDCRSDSFSSGKRVYCNTVLCLIHSTCTLEFTCFRDSLQERLGALDLTTPLRASVVAGLVEVSGAAAFLNHPTQSQLQDRVTLCYRTSTRLDMLSHTLLHSGAPLSLTSQKTATHVVVAVLYGIQAFFVFDDKRESREGSTALNEVIKRNFISHSATELLSALDENQKTKCLFDCAVYTDKGNFKSSVNFDTAIKMYSSLQTLGPQGEKTVPLKVWLYPLKNVDQTSACVVGELNEHILFKTENVLEHLKCHLSICLDMTTIYSSLGVFTRFPAVKESLSEISFHLQKYQLEIQKALASCIKTKRERGQKEGRGLEDLLNRHGQSPFSPENIQQWFLNKDAEVRALQACREKNITTVKSQEELMCIVRDSQDTVLCFTLTSLEDKDPFLSALKQHIDLVSTVNTQETHLPFRLPDTSQKILSDLHSFMCTKETNEDADQTEFIAAVVPVPQLPGSSIYLYQCGNIVNCKELYQYHHIYGPSVI
uniref:SNTX thioredoxin-like domain-containing protein n=1 Tax=Electrophorus electricus TaxID=8005 RepID=A0AAY5EF89_ELEEL